MAALCEEMLGISLLKIPAADLRAGYLCGDRQNRYAAAVTIVKAVDQVEIAWAATAGAHGQVSCEMRFRAGCKGGCFFMPYVHPLHIPPHANGVGNAVQRIAGNTIDPACSC